MGILSRLSGLAPDPHGQAPFAAFRSEAVTDRQIDELIGLIKGVIADGNVSQGEADYLLRWLETNRAAREMWPAKVVYPRLLAALADGKLDSDEESDLLALFLSTVGGNAPARDESSMATALPLTVPAPAIIFADRAFCFTGKFFSGTRAWCEEQVTARGGRIGSITRELRYLVIGEIGSRDWLHSTHGRKIEKAVDYNGRGSQIAIVAERHWHGYLG